MSRTFNVARLIHWDTATFTYDLLPSVNCDFERFPKWTVEVGSAMDTWIIMCGRFVDDPIAVSDVLGDPHKVVFVAVGTFCIS